MVRRTWLREASRRWQAVVPGRYRGIQPGGVVRGYIDQRLGARSEKFKQTGAMIHQVVLADGSR